MLYGLYKSLVLLSETIQGTKCIYALQSCHQTHVGMQLQLQLAKHVHTLLAILDMSGRLDISGTS